MKVIFHIGFLILLMLVSVQSFAQSKLNLTPILPKSIQVCGDGVELSIDLRNITTGTVQNIYLEVALPSGLEYVKNSYSGSGISERNVNNLNKPLFNFPRLTITQSRSLKIKVTADCDILNIINAGKLATINFTAYYSGGSTSLKSSPLTIEQPTVQIKSVTNRFAQTDLDEIFVRKITIINSGRGRLSSLDFRQINDRGIKLLGVSGGTITFSRDTVFTEFQSSHFTQIGNKDQWLDQNEEVVVYDTLQTIGCKNLSSSFQASWGCNSKICQKTSSSANVTIKPKLPTLVALAKTALTTCLDSSNTFQESLRLINTGNDTARIPEILIFQAAGNGYYQYMLSKILENSFQIKTGKNGTSTSIAPSSTSTTYNKGGYACLGLKPIGEATLNLPNINPGDTLFISWKVKSCCPDVCNFNFYVNRWNYKGYYRDQCDNIINLTERRGTNGYYSRLTMNSFAPSDVGTNDTAVFSYEITNVGFIPNSRRSKYIFDFIKPQGLNHSLAKSDFFFVDIRGRKWEPKNISPIGDTIRAQFFGYIPITIRRAELKVRMTINCSKSKKSGDQNYQLRVRYNADTSCTKFCTYEMTCLSGKINIHCGLKCSGGLRFSDFDVERISFGQPDNDNNGIADATGSIDLDKIKTERVMFGDTLQTTFKGQFLDLGSTTAWRYLKASSYIPYGTFTEAVEVRLKIYRNRTLLYNCDNIPVNYTNSGVHRTYNFDASIPALISAKCPLFSGFSFTKKDSVELQVKYVIKTNPGNAIRNIDFVNSFYTSTVANPSRSQRIQCDTFSGRCQFVGYYFTNWGSNVFSTNSCNTIDVYQNFYLSVGNCCGNYAGGNIFPFEYRNWAKLKSVNLILPKGYQSVYSNFRQYRTAGTGSTATDVVDSLKPYAISGDTVKYRTSQFYEDQSGKVKLSDDGFHGTFRARLIPNCDATSGENRVQYDFEFQEKGFLGSKTQKFSSGASSDKLIYDAPSISMAVAQEFVFAKSDTIVWTIRLNNISPTSTAENLWLSAELNSNVSLISVKRLSSGNTIFGDSGVFKLNKLSNGASIDLELRAVFNNCNRDSINVLVGYDCIGYPSSSTNLKCPKLTKYLSFVPINTRLEANLKDSAIIVELCKDVWYEVDIANTGEAKVFGLHLDLVLRPGMTLGDSAWLFLEGTQDSVAVTNPINISGATWRWEINKFDTTLLRHGLSGISGDNDLTLKFRLSTDCNFVSSSFFLARPGGILKCGRDVFSAFEVGNPIDIDGIKKPYFSNVSFIVEPLNVCQFNDSIEVKFINLGPDSTSSTDRLQLTMSQGMRIDTAALNPLHNGPRSVAIRKLPNSEAYVWDLPIGLPPGDSVHFKSRIITDLDILDCGISEILLQALVEQPALCVKTNKWCDIDVATSSFQILDSVRKSDIFFTFGNASSRANGSFEEVNLNYSLTNRGTSKPQFDTLKIWIAHDRNNNGIYDFGDTILYRDKVSQEFNRDTTIVRAVSFNSPPVATCNLIISVDTSACVCLVRNLVIPPISIKNAGEDTIICSGNDVLIGLAPGKGNKYSWVSNPGIANTDSAQSNFSSTNSTSNILPLELVLRTDKGSCKSSDTVLVSIRPAIKVSLRDTVSVCIGQRVFIGQTATGGSGGSQYQWNPTADLSTPNTSRSWAQPSNSTMYTVSITDKENCFITDSTLVQVMKLPIIAFDVTDTCADSITYIVNKSVSYNGPFLSYNWTIDSKYNGDENPSLTIPTPGRYAISLTAIDSQGCMASANDSFDVYENPKASFILNDACELDTAVLIGTSTISSGPLSQIWHIGANTISGDTIKWAESASGFILVQLEASNSKCTHTITDSFYVHDIPRGSISGSDVCLNIVNTFKSILSIDKLDTISSLSWKLSDGSSYSGDSIKHQFLAAGNFSIELITTSKFGCIDTIRYNTVVNPNPVALVSSVDVCENEDLWFIGSGSIGNGSISSYYWDTGNGFKKGLDSISIPQAKNGFFTADLILESDQGCRDTISKTAYVHQLDNFNISQVNHCEYDSIQFRHSSSNADSISYVKWSFHDGDSLNDLIGKKLFETYGVFNADIALGYSSGCKNDTSFKVTIQPAPVSVLFPYLPCDDLNVAVVDQSTTPLGVLVSRAWTLNGNTYGASDTMKFKASNTVLQNFTLEVENEFGCSDTSQGSIVPYPDPLPRFAHNDACLGEVVQIKNTSNSGLMNILKVSFDMDDGSNIDNQDSFDYYYSSPGSYNVQLRLRNDKNCVYSSTESLSIHDLPISDFILDPEEANVLNSEIDITDLSIDAISTSYWISDGSVFSGSDFKHQFLDSGLYLVKQYVESAEGCRDSSSKTIRIHFEVAVWVPNSFTPNGDGRNDAFRPYGAGIESFNMSIYNRWGEKIFGTVNGKSWEAIDELPGVYVYKIEIFDYEGIPHYMKGTVHLLK